MQPNRVGRLSYVRRIPADLRPFAGNQKVIRRSLGLRTTNQSDPAVIQAWNRAHEEAEALLHQTETHKAAADVRKPSLKQEPTPLKPRDRVCQLNALLKSNLPGVRASRDAHEFEHLRAEVNRQLLAPVFGALDIEVDALTYARIEKQLGSYLEDVQADLKA